MKNAILNSIDVKVVAQHILVWIVILLLPHLLFGISFEWQFVKYQLLFWIVPIIIFYINSEILVPYLLIKQKYIYYIYSIVLLALIYIVTEILLNPLHVAYYELMQDVYRHPLRFHHQLPIFPNPFKFITFSFIILTSGMYSYVVRNVRRELKMKELEKAQIASNLQLLKSQLSPHFLFNALNSLYSLSITKSEKLPEAILTVSNLLRYVTYDSEENIVKVQQEIDYILNYVKLQQMRLSPDSKINIQIDNDNEEATISPMIFTPFVENVFKHGVSSDCIVDVSMIFKISKESIEFSINNKKFNDVTSDKKPGIGIQNITTRLKLLYGSKYSLDIQDLTDIYKVYLKIKLI